MDEAESCDIVGFIFNGKIIKVANPQELLQQENAKNLESIFISYVENITNRKVSSTFKEMKFLHGDQ